MYANAAEDQKYFVCWDLPRDWEYMPDLQRGVRKRLTDELQSKASESDRTIMTDTIEESIGTRMSDGRIVPEKWSLDRPSHGGYLTHKEQMVGQLAGIRHEIYKTRRFLETGKPVPEPVYPVCHVLQMTVKARKWHKPQIPKATFVDKDKPDVLTFI